MSMLREELRQMVRKAESVFVYLHLEDTRRKEAVSYVQESCGIDLSEIKSLIPIVSKQASELLEYLKRCEAEWDAIERGVADVRTGRIGGMPLVTSGDQQGVK